MSKPPHIRWMIRSDLPEVLAIEEDVFEYPWPEDEFIRVLKQPNCIGVVAMSGARVAGYMVYEMCKARLNVLNLAVARGHQRRGVGRAMVEKLRAKLSRQGRSRILLNIRETNIAAQFFFRSLGFKAVQVLREFYDFTGEDAYTFQFRLSREELTENDECSGDPKRRLSGY